MTDISHTNEAKAPPDSALASLSSPPPPSYAQTLLFGPDGLRPGWGLAIYVLVFFCLEFLAGEWEGSWSLGALRALGLGKVVDVLACIIPALVLMRIERRPWRDYGLPLRQAFGKLFWVGAVWGFIGISVLIAALYGSHVFAFGHVVLHGLRIARFAGFWAAMFLLVALFEEFLFRGYTQFTLARGIRFWPAAVSLTCVFSLIHRGNIGETWLGLLAVAAIGFFFCLTLRRTGSLWFAVGFHAAWDWGETFFYSVPDSGMVAPGHLLSSSFHGPAWLTGGTAGPEGSVVCFVVIAAAWVAFDRVYPRANSSE